jgi:NADPH:quinone reductase-like Zn-dependent oxidoreductase
MGILGGGGHAEVVCVDAGLCVRIPDNLSWEEAGAVPEAFATAFDALFLQAGLTKRETLLVQAAASGVGTAAASLALALGAKVIGGSRSADKRLRLSDLGLTHVFDPAEDGLEETLRRAAGADGIDVALDLVGAPAVPLELEVLGDGGRIVVIGLLGGAHALVDLAVVMRKRLRLSGSVLRGRPLEQKIELTRAWDRHVSPLLASGRVAPIVDRSFPLERAAEAHAYMEGNRNFGKIVLNIG